MKLLFVEDDHFYSATVKEMLEDNGFNVTCVDSVQEALSQKQDEMAAIISDVMLPNNPAESGVSAEETRSGYLSGVALLRKFRKNGFQKPVILVSGNPFGEAPVWAARNCVPFISKDTGPQEILKVLKKLGLKGTPPLPTAFIVHGHDEAPIVELKDYLQNTLKWPEPIILRDQPSLGKTIIEKFEEFSGRIDCVFVLLTPDDSGAKYSTDDERRRARQNVIFELGFFYAQMGRRTGRVIVLRKGPVEIPTDIQGIVWIDVSNGVKPAGEQIRKETMHLTN